MATPPVDNAFRSSSYPIRPQRENSVSQPSTPRSPPPAGAGRELSELPEELISNIACRLDSDDKFALRLTCRALEEKSFHEFATEHFSKKCVHFTTDSLQSIVDISHSRLARNVKELSIITALFLEQDHGCPAGHKSHWKPTVRQSEAHKFYAQDQLALRTTGRDKEMLTEALKSLSALKSISLIDSEKGLSAEADYRGSRKARRRTGSRPINGCDSVHGLWSKEFRQHLEHLWSTLLAALAGAHEHLSLEELKTHCVAPNSFLTSANFKIKQPMLKTLPGVLNSISRLELWLESSKKDKEFGGTLSKFGATLSHLKHLSLHFDHSSGSGKACQKLIAKVDFSQLISLRLSGFKIAAPALVKMMTCLKEVRELRLEWINATDGSWPAVLQAIANFEHIDHLHLKYLSEGGCKSYFLKQEPLEGPDGYNIPGTPFDDGWNTEGDGESSEDDIPNLEPASQSGPEITQQADGGAPGLDNDAVNTPLGGEPVISNDNDDDDMPDYVPADGTVQDCVGQRGFYVCLEGHGLIMKRLPTFITQYNVGDFTGGPGDDGFMDFGAFTVAGGALPMPPSIGPPVPAGTGAAIMAAVMNAAGLGPHGPLPAQNAGQTNAQNTVPAIAQNAGQNNGPNTVPAATQNNAQSTAPASSQDVSQLVPQNTARSTAHHNPQGADPNIAHGTAHHAAHGYPSLAAASSTIIANANANHQHPTNPPAPTNNNQTTPTDTSIFWGEDDGLWPSDADGEDDEGVALDDDE